MMERGRPARHAQIAPDNSETMVGNARLPAFQRAAITEALMASHRLSLVARVSHKREGTSETHIHALRRRQWPIERMYVNGYISAGEYAAAEEIASIVEQIERQVDVRCASLEARVDHSASARNMLVESLTRIRMEVTYRLWRQGLPRPPRMILDMICSSQPHRGIAARYRVARNTARKRLIDALEVWTDIRSSVSVSVDEEAIIECYRRLGEGVLLEPPLAA